MNRESVSGDIPPLPVVFLIPAILAPLAIALLWGDAIADEAYLLSHTAEAIAASELSITSAPSYAFPLVPAAWLGLPVPLFAASLSVLGWIAAISAWFAIGRTVDRPTLSLSAAALLALHPLQAQVLGLKTGVVLGVMGLVALGIVRARRMGGPSAAALTIGLSALLILDPLALAFVVPLITCRLIQRRSPATAPQLALGAASYVLVGLLLKAWGSPHHAASILAMGEIVIAVGFAAILPRLADLTHSTSDRRSLGQGIAALAMSALIAGQIGALVHQWRLRPVDRIDLYREAASWLEQQTLPDETIATERPGLLGYLTRRPTLALSAGVDAQALLAAIDHLRPDACVALDTIAWQGVRAQPWFQARYERVYQVNSPYDAAAPLTVFRYHPTPFDAGSLVTITTTFSSMGERVTLTGYRVEQQRLTPGTPFHVTLYWRAASPLSDPLTLKLRLRAPETGTVWAEVDDAAPGGLPTNLWNVDEEMVTRYAPRIPPDLPPGDYTLDVALIHPNGSALITLEEESAPYTFADVFHPPDVSEIPPQPDRPFDRRFGDAIALVGYDAPAQVAPGESLRVALYWHALADIPFNYKVFVHLIGPDGHLAAQADSVPVGWTYPTEQWEAGQFIRDEHVLTLDPTTPRGDYRLSVGMYDPETGHRLAVISAEGEPGGDRAMVCQVRVR